jgi:hypothetical protein
MSTPTIASRLQRRFVLMSGDDALAAALRASLPANWQMVQTNDVGELGGFEEILQYRFILLDLDAGSFFDPLETIREVRMQLMLNVPIFCCGGDGAMRDDARLARADRFFERAEMVGRMRQFCDQYGWGE